MQTLRIYCGVQRAIKRSLKKEKGPQRAKDADNALASLLIIRQIIRCSLIPHHTAYAASWC